MKNKLASILTNLKQLKITRNVKATLAMVGMASILATTGCQSNTTNENLEFETESNAAYLVNTAAYNAKTKIQSFLNSVDLSIHNDNLNMDHKELINENHFVDFSQYDSIVDALNAIGYDSSFASRKELANKYGMPDYSGTFNENITLKKLLEKSIEEGKLDFPGLDQEEQHITTPNNENKNQVNEDLSEDNSVSDSILDNEKSEDNVDNIENNTDPVVTVKPEKNPSNGNSDSSSSDDHHRPQKPNDDKPSVKPDDNKPSNPGDDKPSNPDDNKPSISPDDKDPQECQHIPGIWVSINDELEETECSICKKILTRIHKYIKKNIKTVSNGDATHTVYEKEGCVNCGHEITKTLNTSDCYSSLEAYDFTTEGNHMKSGICDTCETSYQKEEECTPDNMEHTTEILGETYKFQKCVKCENEYNHEKVSEVEKHTCNFVFDHFDEDNEYYKCDYTGCNVTEVRNHAMDEGVRQTDRHMKYSCENEECDYNYLQHVTSKKFIREAAPDLCGWNAEVCRYCPSKDDQNIISQEPVFEHTWVTKEGIKSCDKCKETYENIMQKDPYGFDLPLIDDIEIEVELFEDGLPEEKELEEVTIAEEVAEPKEDSIVSEEAEPEEDFEFSEEVESKEDSVVSEEEPKEDFEVSEEAEPEEDIEVSEEMEPEEDLEVSEEEEPKEDFEVSEEVESKEDSVVSEEEPKEDLETFEAVGIDPTIKIEEDYGFMEQQDFYEQEGPVLTRRLY